MASRHKSPSEERRGVRLQKILAQAGVASRRASEELIEQGRVSVNGDVVTELGSRADPEEDEVRVDGVSISIEPRTYFLVNKPKGVVCSSSRNDGKPRAIDLVPAKNVRLFTVGRLDEDTEGLLILTNDGNLAQRISHPRHGVSKTYLARVAGHVDHEVLERLRKGVFLAEGRTRPADVRVRRRGKRSSVLRIEVQEGRNRMVRRALAKVGLACTDLTRTAIGGLGVNELRPGQWRRVGRDELEQVFRTRGRRGRKGRKRGRGRGRGRRR